ncbi:MAG: hypothetical protein J0I12_08655 [Candidatus Eremiobacteraeota bacterium]|nr:hypothetical protein [Candidatus Eremiobacteraeota bacterium]
MKIQPAAAFQFAPKRLHSENSMEERPEQLQAENPAFVRTVDLGKLGHDAMGMWQTLQASPLGRTASGGVAAGAGIWGANKILRGQTVLDRVEGVSLLAMAASKAEDAGGNHHPGVSTVANLVQGGADLILGAADTVRGVREHNNRRLTVGICQMAIGACLGTSALVPSVAGISTAVMCAAVVTKQLAIGFHTSLPDK